MCILVREMVSRNLIVLNRDHEMTFRRGSMGSIINFTFAAP